MMLVSHQVAFHASAALRQYFRTHLVLHVATLKRRYCGHAAVKQVPSNLSYILLSMHAACPI